MKNKPINHLLISVVILSLFAKCTTSNYYLNSLNGNHHYYHSIPLKSDSIVSALYFGSSIDLGAANYSDGVKSFGANIYRTHSFGIIQAYYEAGVTIGRYNVIKKRPDPYGSRDTTRINTYNNMTGPKFFGGYGFDGGLNIVVPVGRKGSEWRIIGFETSLQEEFGNYLKFRKNLPDSVSIINMKSSFFPTIGFSTEIVCKVFNTSIGYRISIGTSLKKENENKFGLRGILTADGHNPFYFIQTYHYTYQNWTLYGQLNIASYSIFLQGGFNYKLGTKRKK